MRGSESTCECLAGACPREHGAHLEGCIQALLIQHERHQSASRHAAIQHKPPTCTLLPSVAGQKAHATAAMHH